MIDSKDDPEAIKCKSRGRDPRALGLNMLCVPQSCRCRGPAAVSLAPRKVTRRLGLDPAFWYPGKVPEQCASQSGAAACGTAPRCGIGGLSLDDPNHCLNTVQNAVAYKLQRSTVTHRDRVISITSPPHPRAICGNSFGCSEPTLSSHACVVWYLWWLVAWLFAWHSLSFATKVRKRD